MAHLKKGAGYWWIDHYPIGGCFRRAKQRLEIHNIYPLDRPYKGATHGGEIRFCDASSTSGDSYTPTMAIAFSERYLE